MLSCNASRDTELAGTDRRFRATLAWFGEAMTRLLLLVVAIAAGLAFSVAVPTLAVAGLQAVPVAKAPSSNACVDEAKDLSSLVIETCRKKSQSGEVILCPQVYAVVPAMLRSAAAPIAETPPRSTDLQLSEAGSKRLLRPPRG